MQISRLSDITLNPHLKTFLNKTPQDPQPVSIPNGQKEQKIFVNNLAARGISFKRADENKTTENLCNEYKWYVNNDKTRPLDAFLKIKTNEKGMNSLFTEILKNDELSYDLIDDIAGRARNSIGNYKFLEELLGNDSENIRLFMPQNPYGKAFSSFMDKKVSEAKSLFPLLKLRPDWKEDVLIKKYAETHNENNFQIGVLPDEFQNGRFEKITDYLQQFTELGHKVGKHIPSIKIDNRNYEFEFFTEGKTDKNVFGVYTPEKKYVFKIAPPENRGLNKPFALGTLALIDSYLTLNDCRNSAPLYYYNHEKNACIYKYQDHNLVSQKLTSPTEINNYMPDFKALGMYYNDTIGNNNYFLSDVPCHSESLNNYMLKNELISVDNDHVTFSSPFMLSVTKYNSPLPNAMQNAF